MFDYIELGKKIVDGKEITVNVPILRNSPNPFIGLTLIKAKVKAGISLTSKEEREFIMCIKVNI